MLLYHCSSTNGTLPMFLRNKPITPLPRFHRHCSSANVSSTVLLCQCSTTIVFSPMFLCQYSTANSSTPLYIDQCSTVLPLRRNEYNAVYKAMDTLYMVAVDGMSCRGAHASMLSLLGFWVMYLLLWITMDSLDSQIISHVRGKHGW